MKFPILFAFSALLGFFVANATQDIYTGASKTVPQLIAEYERLIGGIGQDESLFARRRGRNYGGQVPVSGTVPTGLVITDDLDDAPYAGDYGSGEESRVSTIEGLKYRGYKNGDPDFGNISKGKRVGFAPVEYSSSGGSSGRNSESSSDSAARGRRLSDASTTGGLGQNGDNVANGAGYSTGFSSGGLSSNGGTFGSGSVSSSDSVAGGRSFSDGSRTGGYLGTGAEYSDDYTAGGLSSNGGSLGSGSAPSSDSVAGGRKFSDGSANGGQRPNDDLAGKGLDSGISSTPGSLSSSSSFSDDNPVNGKTNYETDEESETGTLSPTMKNDISEIKTAFELAVADKYVGMTNRKLWRELMKKQKQLAAVKLQLQNLMYNKREKLRKHYGMSPKHFRPSKALSMSIMKNIDGVVAFRPSDYVYHE